MSLYTKHVSKWKDCTLCELHEHRSRVVLAKGTIPCDILMIGEAPGLSEDTIGRPFEGPAGHKLDEIIAAAVGGWPRDKLLRVAFTNIVCCLPIGEEGTKVHEPPKSAVKACTPRLNEFLDIARPKLIVAVGAVADKYLPAILGQPDPEEQWRYVTITHPAAILRMEPMQAGLAITRCVVTISDAIQELEEANSA